MQTILERLRAAGARPKHESRMLRAWLAGRSIAEPMSAHDQPFPRALIAAVPAIERELAALVRVVSEHAGEDGSSRLLLALEDGRTIESVLLLRDGLCVSTQVGCAVGCVFCMTGRDGLLRQLSSAEIVAQVALGRAKRPGTSLGRTSVRRVVFMGMGEPSHNLDAVLEAIDVLGTYGDLGHKNLVFSTIGDRRAFERLAQGRVKPALALSLHTTDAKLREQLLSRAPKIAPEELIDLADRYARATTYPIQYQWTLIEGVNDSDVELERLAELMQGRYGVVNFIPYNEVEGLEWKRPSWDRARAMSQYLHQHGVLCKLRRSAGQDVDGGCGQLRARTLAANT
jgi:23S rRNA (adenine2503-C2)-methyltransferase